MLKGYRSVAVSSATGDRRFVQKASVGGGGGNFSTSASSTSSNGTNGVLDGIINVNDAKTMRAFYRDMYWHDTVAGSTVDLMSNLPYSDFSLSGVNDPKMLQTYMLSVDNLGLKTLLPSLSVDFYVLGAFVASLSFSAQRKVFENILPHDLDACEMTPMPVYGMDPMIDLTYPKEVTKLLSSPDPRVASLRKAIPTRMLEGIKKGKMPLDPATTLYVPRRSFSTASIGESYFRRLVPIWLLEKALLRGTIDQANRRQRAIIHAMMGDEDWEPTQEELDSLGGLLLSADQDPVNAVISTRQGISFQEIKRGDDFWRYDQIYDFASGAKMRALGVSEAFLSGEANYNAVDTALSVFVEQLRAHRDMVTRELFYDKLFPAVAIANNFKKTKRDKMVTSLHDMPTSWRGSRILKDERGCFIALCDGGMGHDFQNVEDITQYHIPTVNWHRQLKPSADENYINMLGTLTDRGLPVPIRMMAAAGGMSLDEIVAQLDDDLKIRERFAEHNKAVAEFSPPPPDGGGGGSAWASVMGRLPGQGGVTRLGLGARNIEELAEAFAPAYRNKAGARRLTTAKGQRMIENKINKVGAEALTAQAETERRRQRHQRAPR
jgi:hypothetical protein